MGGIGGMELLVIGLVALIVVGPKDLPGMFRTLGQFTAKAKRMAREFTTAMENAADEAGVKDVAKDIRAMSDPKKMGLDAVKKATNLDPDSETGKLSKERAEAAEKIRKASAEAAEARKAREIEEATKAATDAAKSEASKT